MSPPPHNHGHRISLYLPLTVIRLPPLSEYSWLKKFVNAAYLHPRLLPSDVGHHFLL
jgi:hypothetical protein